jgi:hypothetical protein
MFTADEARAKTEVGIAEQLRINRNSIITAIQSACDDGHYHCTWQASLDEEFKKELEGKGFRISNLDKGTYYEKFRIEWS